MFKREKKEVKENGRPLIKITKGTRGLQEERTGFKKGASRR